VHIRKPPAHIETQDFLPWTTVHFRTREARDGFLQVASALPEKDVEVRPLQDECCGASVRWRPGKFLGLNDVAHAHGGRIVVTIRPRGVTAR
jgi:hypothetical protein